MQAGHQREHSGKQRQVQRFDYSIILFAATFACVAFSGEYHEHGNKKKHI